MANGGVFYRGPSMIDGSPIVAIATRVETKSTNSKTGGDIVQTFILRSDMSPTEAIHSGADASICGSCPHRGKLMTTATGTRNVERTCYVLVFQAPTVVYKAFTRGVYPELTLADAAELLRDRMVRLGAYGDPAAVPFEVWQALLVHTSARAGYTHQWRVCDQRFAQFAMASCDSEDDMADAKAMGWRTFRIRAHGAPIAHREVVCPASKESGFKTTCDQCKACGGLSSKARADIVIEAHRHGQKYFQHAA